MWDKKLNSILFSKYWRANTKIPEDTKTYGAFPSEAVFCTVQSLLAMKKSTIVNANKTLPLTEEGWYYLRNMQQYVYIF